MSATTELFIALSPDGFLITADFVPLPIDEAETALKNWIERYKQQGHYTDSRLYRIPFDEIYDECYLLPMSKSDVQKLYKLQKYGNDDN